MLFAEWLNFENSCSMKYPPVVSSLEEWLDGQFGIQGIDAVSCAFYVLSLLQRDNSNDPKTYFQFPCSKIVDDQALSYWPQNNWSTWGFGCYENSLAAKRVSATIEKYEIEHLGNNLSPSLKSIKSGGGDSVTQQCLCEEQALHSSAYEPAEKCQQLFSIGGQNSFGGEKFHVEHCPCALWANESACVGFFKYKPEGRQLDRKDNSDLIPKNIVNEKDEDIWMAAPTEKENDLFLHDGKLPQDEGNCEFFSWNITDPQLPYNEGFKSMKDSQETRGIWDTGSCLGQIKSNVSISMPHVETDIAGLQDLPEENLDEDGSLAKLIAKFDHSIEAIWGLGSTSTTSCDVADEQPNMPWSFCNVISPPHDSPKVTSVGSEKSLNPGTEYSYFINSGTNIIDSIWSDNSIENHSALTESGVTFAGEGVNNFSNDLGQDHLDLCYKLKFLITGNEKSQNEFNLFEWKTASDVNTSKNCNQDILKEVPEEYSDFIWNKFQPFSSFFSDVNVQEQFCHMRNYSNVDSGSQQVNNSCMISCSPCSVSHIQDTDDILDSAVNGKTDFSALNHNKEDSSFTEVFPRYSGNKRVCQDYNIGNMGTNQVTQSTSSQSSSDDKSKLENAGKEEEEEEEDLLTSARTHFRPIQQESQVARKGQTYAEGISYADGTTFAISSNFTDLPFKRSESGTLFLENEENSDTPKRYMEYKRIGDPLKCAQYIPKDKVGNKGAFIPKFCVRQVEKCCQTDESDESSDEANCKIVKSDCMDKENKSKLFFLKEEVDKSEANCLENEEGKISEETECKDNYEEEEDDKLDEISARNAKNDSVSRNLEADMIIWNKSGCKCNSKYMFSSKSDSLKAFGASFVGEKDGLWEPDSAARLCQSRYSIWSCSPGPLTQPCPSCVALAQDKRVQCSQLREELSEDGEQLLSDLSSLQPLQLSVGWLDDPLDQGGWGTEPNLLTRVSSRRRLVSWGQCGEG